MLMGKLDAENPEILASYEGLIFETARLIAPRVELEMEDIQQVFRVKVWRALVAFDPKKCRTNRDKYVFMCLADQKKDLLKKRLRGELYIDDLAPHTGDVTDFSRDRFEGRYLAASPDTVYASVEDDVLVPNTLTLLERMVVVLLYRDYKQTEIADRLEIDRRDMEKVVKSIREKMEDWRPSTADELLKIAA